MVIILYPHLMAHGDLLNNSNWKSGISVTKWYMQVISCSMTPSLSDGIILVPIITVK